MSTHPSPSRVAAVILAGGKGMRMGGCDKPLLALNEEPLLTHLIRKLAPQCATLALSANGDAARFAPWGIPVLPDTLDERGPLAGVLAGLQWARTQQCDTVLTVPGDTPFISATLVERLLPAPAVAVSGGREHPLIATWPTSCLERLQDWLAQPPSPHMLRVRMFARTLGVRHVTFAGYAPDPFFNINTPEDYASACRMIEKGLINE